MYCIHRGLHHPIIDCLLLPGRSHLSVSYSTQLSTFPWLQVNQWIDSQLPSHHSPDVPLPNRLPPSTPPISIGHGLQVHLQTRLIIASKCISELLDLIRQIHLHTRSITTSKCISELHHLGLQGHLQTRSITAFKCNAKLARSGPPTESLSYSIPASICISKLAQSRPASASLSYKISASKCIFKLAQSQHSSASLSYPISASKCMSKLALSRPPSASPNLLKLWPPSASFSPLDHGLPVLLQTHSITASKCISEFNQISASKCISKLALSQPPSASLSYKISASKCMSTLAWSLPPSAYLSSTRSRPPSASPNTLDCRLHVHLLVHTITASKWISMFSQSSSPGAPAIMLQYRLQPDRMCVYM